MRCDWGDIIGGMMRRYQQNKAGKKWRKQQKILKNTLKKKNNKKVLTTRKQQKILKNILKKKSSYDASAMHMSAFSLNSNAAGNAFNN